MVRFALTPPPPKGPRSEPFAAQLALARVHPQLVELAPCAAGYEIATRSGETWGELAVARGFAGYGLSRALRMLLDILIGMRALHGTQTESRQPFVHGELSPALLRVDELGITRVVPLAPWHWSPGGTPASRERWGHLAPERLLGDAMDQRADVYSGGVLLWEALAGRRLFEHESIDSIVTRLMGGRVNMPELPPELSWAMPLKAVAMRALSVDPEQRFRSCAELAHAIESTAGRQIASHAEIAAYFQQQHPSLVAPPPVTQHNSSLSALVAPLAHSAARLDPATADTEPSPPNGVSRSAARRLLLAAASISVFAGLGIVGLQHHDVARPAARGVTPAAHASEVGASLSSVPVSPLVSAMAPNAAIAPIAPIASIAPVADASGSVPEPAVSARAKPRKPASPFRVPAATSVPKAKVPARSVLSEAEQYGI